MTSTTAETARRHRSRLAAAVLALLGAIGLVLGASAPAQAAPLTWTINGSSASPYPVPAGTTSFRVQGSGLSASTQYVAIAVCNVTLGGDNGTNCNGTTGAWVGFSSGGASTFDRTLTGVSPTFTDFNFQTGAPTVPAHTTTCNARPGANGQCAVQISEYNTPFPSGAPTAVTTRLINYP